MAEVNVKHRLLNVLEDLSREDFQVFKWYLFNETGHGLPRIPMSRLEPADRLVTVDTVVQTYAFKAVEVTVSVLQKMNQRYLAMELIEMNSKGEVKTTVCQYQTYNTATDRGTVVNPHINNSRINNLNFTVVNQGASGDGHPPVQCFHQSWVPSPEFPLNLFPSPERPLPVFPSPLSGVLSLMSGRVDADDLDLLSLMEQWKKLKPQKKSQMMLTIRQMIHDELYPERVDDQGSSNHSRPHT